MNKSGLIGLILVISLFAVFSTGSRTQPGNVTSPAVKDTVDKTQVTIDKEYGKMPLAFIPNKGQMDKQVYFYLQGKDKSVYFTSTGLTYALAGPAESQPALEDKAKPGFPVEPGDQRERELSQSKSRWVVKLDFVNARKEAKPGCLEKSGTVISYFKGKAAEWHTGLQAASKIIYRNLWPGIDLVYYGTVNRMKYEFIVHPGADPAQIKLAYRGAESVKENRQGQLEVQTPVGGFFDNTPIAWQEIAGKRESVTLKYALEKKDTSNPQDTYIYGFSVGEYDRNETLILDPVVLVYCGYIGGSGSDCGNDIDVDASGCAYVTGQTFSTNADFPLTVGPDIISNGGWDAFVAKIKADGTGLDYCGYIGGSTDDRGIGIAVDTSGCAYVTGWTYSSEDTFPVTVGPDLSFNSSCDAFVAKVNAAGSGLVFCGYIGGSGYDDGDEIAVDASGFAYVTGSTNSTENDFPVTIGPDLTHNGGYDTYVAKVRIDGTGLVYCGYIGGSGGDSCSCIAVDDSGCVYLTGSTQSTQADFPVLIGPDLTHNGDYDTFVAKVKADGTNLVYCGYIGGSGQEGGQGIAVDGSSYAYVAGYTGSTETTFPLAVGPDMIYNGGLYDAFVAKVNVTGTALDYCGYIGGTAIDWGYGIAVDTSGCAYVTGFTGSNETTFPVAVGPGLTYNGGNLDAYAAKVSANGTGMLYCGYIGGNEEDRGIGIAVDATGNAYVVGYANSTETTFPITAGPDLTHNGGTEDAFVAKISYGPTPEVAAVAPGVNALGVAKGANISVTFDQDMDQTTINSNTFVVHALEKGLISGTYSYDSGTKTAAFDPAGVFAAGEVVTVTLTTGIESVGSIPLAEPYVWSFTIGVESGYGIFATPAPTYGTGDNPNGSFAADFDNDGDIDVATANMDSNNVSVLINNGNATFTTPAPAYGVGNTPRTLFGGDFDNDGDIDLAAPNSADNTVSVLLNNGNGTFATPAPTYGVGNGSNPLIGDDFDGDGDIDLATGNGYDNTVSVLLNNGDGTFVTPAPAYGVDSSPRGIYRGDFDNDGDMDLVTANYHGSNVSILLNNGDGTFATPAPAYTAGYNCRAVFAADLDNDGDIDLATGNEMTHDISVLLNNGNGTFAGQTSYNVGIGFGAVFGGDFDNDGDIDLAAGGANIYIFWNNGNGTFQTPSVQYNASVSYNGFCGGDFDGSGSFDLALATGGYDAVTLLLNRDITPPSPPQNLTATPASGQVTLQWSANTEPDLQKYNVYRDTSSPASTLIGSVDTISPTEYVDTGLSDGQEYFYRITAVDDSQNESGFSGEASTITFYIISGTVTLSGSPLVDVVVNGLPGNPTTNASGLYTAAVNQGWSGTATPNLSGCQFIPSSRDYSNVSANQTGQDYAAVVAIASIERAALIALYNSTNGDSWINNSGWKTPPLHSDGFAMPGTESTWFGVSCNSGNTAVTSIGIGNNNLSGTLPPEIGNLSNLEYLEISYNSTLTGSIPSTIGNLMNLKGIQLRTNQLTGEIPSGIGNLVNLDNICISQNQLSGNIPESLGNLNKVTHLWLSENQLTGSIPVQLGNMSSLQVLCLSSNELTGSIPGSLGSLSGLRSLWIQYNHFSGAIPPELGNLSNLTGLMVEGNQLSGDIPASLGNLSNLSTLHLFSNKLSGNIPTSLMNLANLSTTFTNIGYNALYATDSDLVTFLNSKDPDWAETQTIAPGNIEAIPVNSTTVNLTWDAITYTGDTGGYRVSFALSPGGPYTFFQQTADKSSTSMSVTGLNPGTQYYFVIQTRTDSHGNQQNTLDSEYSAEVSATTIPVFTVNFLTGSGGTLTGETTQVVDHGSSCSAVTAIPDTGYMFANWIGTGGFLTTTDNPLTVTNVTTDMTITANFVYPNVTGHVTDSGSNGVANVNVTIFDLNYNQVTVQATDSNGDFTITGLAAGNYKVWFDTQGSAGNLAREWYSDQRSFNTANTITVTDGNTTTGIDAQLENGGTIAGIVLNSSANGIENVRVEVNDPDFNYITCGWTNSSGSYSIPGIYPGSYKIRFNTTDTVNFYVREWYNNKSDFQTANFLTVNAGSTTTANAVLADGGAISGRITDETGTVGIANVNVNIWDSNQNNALGVATDANGYYTGNGLAAGNYKIDFMTMNAGNYLEEWYNNKGSFDEADPIGVTTGNTTGIDVQLTAGGILSGQVTDASANRLPNVQVILYDTNFNQVTDTWTDNSGNYSIQKLIAGDYKVFFNAGSAGNFLDEWNNDKNNFDNADVVTISAGNTTTVNAALTTGGTITGRVTDAAGNGIEGVNVQVCDLAQYWLYGAGTDSNGDYTITRVKTGSFKVDFRPYGLPGNYAREWFDNQGTFNTATVVNVTAGNTTANINAQLSYAGSISGRVTDIGNNGIPNVDIIVYDTNGNQVAWSTTDGNGDYTVNSIPSGNHKVQFWPWNAGNYMPEWYDDQATFEQADTLLVIAGETATGIDAQLADSGAISGRVTNADGSAGIANVSVQVCDLNGYWYPGTGTDNDGYYTLRGLPAGNYKIDFRTHWVPGDYVREWYNDQNSFENATPVTVTVGQTTTGIDVALADGGAISGRITDATSTLGLASVDVTIYDMNGNGLFGLSTDGDGYYTVHGLPAGSYKVQFTTHNAVGSYVAEWYNDKNTPQNADAVSVTVGQTTAGIDAQLAEGGYIGGRVVNSGNKGVANVNVNVYDTGGNMLEWSPTDSGGYYTVKGIPAGDHQVQFWTYNAGNYLEEWYNDKNSQSEADLVNVTAGNTTGGINAQLATGGIITGKVMDSSLMGIANVTVSVYDTNGNWRNNYQTDSDGDYTINRLPTGDYKIYFETSGAGNYIREWYNDKNDFESANTVAVTAGNTTKNINAVLADGGAISGRVTDSSGTVGIANVDVGVCDLNQYWYPGTRTDSGGNYTLSGLPAGDYKIQFWTNWTPGNYVGEWYNDQNSFENATPVTVIVNQTTTGIDVQLADGGGISGRVTDSTGTVGIPNVNINVCDLNQQWLNGVSTDNNGYYTLYGAPAGTYKVQFYAQHLGNYANEWWNNKRRFETADEVTVTTENTTTGIDAQLEIKGSITGTVTAASTSTPIEYVHVYVYDLANNEMGNLWTDSSGQYTLNNLDPDNYKVYFNTYDVPLYIEEWYNDKNSFDNADEVTVNENAATTVDAALAQVQDDGYEPNDDFGSAAEITTGTYNDLVYLSPDGDYQGDQDWYKIYVGSEQAGKNLKVNLRVTSPYPENPPSGWASDLDFDILEGTGRILGKVLSSSDNETLVIGNLAEGWYYIALKYCTVNYGPDGTGVHAVYSMTVAVDTAANLGIGQISGRVIDEQGQGIGDSLTLLMHNPYDWSVSFPIITTDAHGYYTIGYVPGNYTLQFNYNSVNDVPPAPNYVSEYYNDKSLLADAQVFSIHVGSSITGIDAVLTAGATIEGTLTHSNGNPVVLPTQARVTAVDKNSRSTISYTFNDVSGNYSIKCLPPGTYKIQFRGRDENWVSYAREWYNNQPSLGTGDDVVISTVGQVVTGIDNQFSPQGIIRGRVTNGNNEGIGNVQIEVYSVLDPGNIIFTGLTDGDGYYGVRQLPAGDMKIHFNADVVGTPYVSEWYDNTGTFNDANTITLTVGQIIDGIDAQLSSKGNISGRVTDASGTNGIANVDVNLKDMNNNGIDGTNTDENGYYSLDGIPAGDYKVEFSPNNVQGNYLREWYNDKSSFENADTVTVNNGQTTGGIDAQLAEGGAVSGRVTDASGTLGIAGVDVTVYDAAYNWKGSNSTDSNGDYTINCLPAGSYKIEFATSNAAGNYVGEWYNDKNTFENADAVTVTAGQTTSGVNAQLAQGGAISGRATNASGTVGIANVYVGICDPNRYWYNGTNTDGSGYYTIHGLPAGNYKIEFRTNWTPGNWVGEWYNDKTTFESADAVTVTVGQTTTGIDAQLADGGAISGRVTDETGTVGIYNVNVNICDPVNNWHWYNGVSTDSNGYYTIYGLTAGNYKIQFQTNNAPGNYTGEWYNDKNSFANADVVTVTVGQVTGGIDAQLSDGASIAGRVTDSSGTVGIANVSIQIRDLNNTWYPGTNTDSSGYYTLRGLAAGDYKIQFLTSWTPGDYIGEWYNDKYSFDSADTITVTVGQAVTGIDAQLADGGAISGRVTDSTGTVGIANVNVNINDLNRNGLPGVSTDSSGYYTVHGLPAGDYKIEFQANNTANYLSEWYNDKNYFENADAVTVTVGQTTTGIDARLAEGGGISGRVTDSSDSGIQNIDVQAYDLDYRWINSVRTDSNGDYTLSHLPAGSVKVYFETNQAGNYVTEWYNDKGYFETADAITIIAGQTQENIDAQLADGGIISGRVINEADEGIQGVRVRILYPDGNWASQSNTDASGNYTVQRLAQGSYKIDFYTANANGSYVREWYDNESSVIAADLVEVTPGNTFTANAVLAAGGMVTGRVTNDQGAGIQGVRVQLRDLTNTNRFTANTNANGDYTIKTITTGLYKVFFNSYGASSGSYLPEFYNDKLLFKDGETISVTGGQTITGIDAVLAPGCTISGTVTDESGNPLEMIDVYVLGTDGTGYGGTYTDGSGHYQLNGLTPGNYKVWFYPYERNYFGIEYYGYPTNTNYRIEWYNNKDTFVAGDAVSTSLESPATGIDAVLTENGGGITGRITDSFGNGIANCSIALFQSEYNTDWYDSNYTNSQGNYEVKGLAPGNWKLLVLAPGGTFYRREFYNNILDYENATPVPVAAGETTTGIDFVLEEGGLIAGRVTDGSGNGLPNIYVRLLDPTTNKYLGWIGNSGRTDWNGNYTAGARAGQWKVMFQTCDPLVSTYLSEYYDDQSTVENAAIITVTPEQTVTGIDAVLTSGGGKISGYVKDPANTGLYNAEIDVYDTQYENMVGFAFSDSSGYFEVSGLIPGNYKIFVNYNNIYPTEWYSDQTTYETAHTLAVTEGGDTPVTIILGGSNPDQSGISGRVIDSTGGGITNLKVMVYDVNQNYVKSENSDNNGDYVITGLAPGSYKIYFDGPSAGNYLSEWYNDKGVFDEADVLTLETGQSLQGIDAQLADGGIISGQVTNETGNGIENVRVRVRTLDGNWIGNAYTGADGNYLVQCLASASYKVYFFTAPAVGMYVSEWYNDKSSFNLADPIPVTTGETTPLSVVLEAGGNISGQVIDQTQAGIYRVQVQIKDLTNVNRASTLTDDNGNYLVKGLPVGDYKVYFNPTYSNLNYIAEWYADKDSFKNGDMVGVTLGNTTEVNAELAVGSSISGTVKDDSGHPLEFVEVYVYDTNGIGFGGTYTDSSGHYEINGLPAGNYKVNFYPDELDNFAVEWYGLPRNYNYQYEWYNDQASFITAGLVPVTLETPTTGIDAVLTENGGIIAGRITDGTGNGLAGCIVYAFQSEDDFDWYQSGYSDAQGNYQVRGLPAGNYKVCVINPPAYSFYRRVFYNNTVYVDQAALVPVLAGQTTAGIDMVLSKGGIIKGRVTDSSGKGIGYVLVRPIDAATNQYIGWTTGNANTDARGYYLINVRAGTWKVMFETNNTYGGYRSEFYNDTTTVETAATFTVNPEQTVSGIDAVLSIGGGTVSGYVKNSAGTGLANVAIEVYDSQYNIAVGPTGTDASGYFEVPGLLPGNYTICARYSNVYPTEWYSDKTTYETADAILVTEGRNTPVTIILGGANPNLPNLSGQVRNYAGTGLENVQVKLYDLNQEFIVSVTTNATGDYAFYNIPAGEYKLYSDASAVGNYISEWYRHTLSFDEAETLTVTAEVPLEHIDVGLTAGGIIAGQITNETGQGIQGVRVVIRDRERTWIAAVDSDASGNYSVSRLVPDSYKVYFNTGSAVGLYVKEWYNDKENFNTADLVVVPAGETTTLDVTLTAGGAISGTITNGTGPIENMMIDIYALNGIYINTGYTDSSGNYLVKGVPAGTYKVNFNPWELNYHGMDWYGLPRNYDYQYQWYNQKDGFVEADEVVVTVGNTATGIDAVMSETAGGIISGRITDSTGNGIAGCCVHTFESIDSAVEWYYSENTIGTGQDGNYEIKGLPTGNYIVLFFPPEDSLYKGEFYNNTRDGDLAVRVPVTAGQTTSGIDAELEKGGIVSGRVTDSNGTPLQNVCIRFMDAATNKYLYNIRNAARTDEKGEYEVTVNPGQWKAMFQAFDMNAGGYVSEFYNNRTTVETANVITVAAEEPTPNIDAVLSLGGGKISGYVKDPTNTGLHNALVYVYDSQYLVIEGETATDSIGYFEVAGLIPGNHTVYTCYNEVYPPEWYSDQTAHETAKPLAVTTGGNTYIEVVLGGDDPVNPGALRVTSPNGGESLTGGTVHQVTWTVGGTYPGKKVIIEYTIDDGATWKTITSTPVDAGRYDWTVPAVNSAACRARITIDEGDAGMSDVSDGLFGIVSPLPPSIRLLSPKRWIEITAGTVQNITWTSTGNISQVAIEYSTNSGTTWNTIAASAPNTGSYQWTVPDTPSQHCHLRIRLGDGDGESAPFDMTEIEFSIVTTTTPTLTVTSPNGGESWRVGNAQTITWAKTGNVPNVKLEYSTNNGSSWIVIIASTANTGSYPWTVPNSPSGQCKVRVSDIDNNPTDMSNAVFSIAPLPTLTLTSPNGGETWQVGTAHDITWTWAGSSGDVKIEYSTDSGTSWNLVTPSAGGGIYSWTVPDTPSQACLVRVSRSDSEEGPGDVSNGVFTIEAASLLSLESPNGGEQWKTGDTYRITWTADNLEGNVVIDLYRGDDFDFNIGTVSVNDGRMEWKIPENFKNANDYRVVIHKDQTEDSSDTAFSITYKKPNNPDFDNDGKVDIIWKNPVTGQNEVWYMEGIRRKAVGNLPPAPGKDFQVVGTADFNRDGKVDILWHDSKNGQNLVWYMDGIMQKGTALLPSQPDKNWQVEGTGDFNSDGQVDILWRHVLKGLGQVWLMNGVTVAGQVELPAGEDLSWSVVGTGDFNDDGKVDILWRNVETGRNEVWFVDGVVRTGIMAVQEQAKLQWQVVGTGDFNGDGHVDILWQRSSDGKHLVWYMDGVVRIGYEYINISPNTNGSETSDLRRP